MVSAFDSTSRGVLQALTVTPLFFTAYRTVQCTPVMKDGCAEVVGQSRYIVKNQKETSRI